MSNDFIDREKLELRLVSANMVYERREYNNMQKFLLSKLFTDKTPICLNSYQ